MVRAMKRADRDVILGIVRATGFFTPAEEEVACEVIDHHLDRPEQRDYYVVVTEDEKGRATGFLAYGPTPLTEGTYDLYWMAVDPKTQGRGYGKELVRWLEAEVVRLSGRLVIIETSSTPTYHPTRQFYLGLGYKEVARIPDFYKPGDDRVIYSKNLKSKE